MKKILSIISLLLVSTTLWAEPIGEQRAREIAVEFFAQHTTRATLSNIVLEWAGDTIGESSASGNALNTSLMYIYNRGNDAGYVIIAGDTNVDPIIAYSLDSTIDTDNMAEATAAILDAWCRQIESARKSAKPISGTTYRATTRSNDALLYETALWNQTDPFNREAPYIDGNYSLTGCAATAMAIICHYNRWPERGVGTTPAYSYEDRYGHTHSIPTNTLGREYNYDKMLMNYNNGFTDEQGDAVAALMKDIGTSIMMQYHPEGSGTYDNIVQNSFMTYFGYAKDLQISYGDGLDAEEWHDTIRENLRKYGPTYFSGSGDSGGHAFVIDGFDTGDHFHFNFGWGGLDNGYYLIPAIEFYKQQGIILNLRPDRDGTSVYRDNICLYALDTYKGITPYEVTSYATDTPFLCRVGYFGNIGPRTFNGEIKLVLCDRDGNWKQELASYNCTIEPNQICLPKEYDNITITTSLEEGDRMRVYYKAYSYDEWQWARSFFSNSTDEVMVMGSPEDIARGFYVAYDKSSKKLCLGNKHAMTIDIYIHNTNIKYGSANLQMNQTVYISDIAAETYRIEASLGSEPYKFVIKL